MCKKYRMDGWMDANKEWTKCRGWYVGRWMRHVETETDTYSEIQLKREYL